MTIEQLPTELMLMPPKRLGALLADARRATGLAPSDVAGRLGGAWSPTAVLDAERGRHVVRDEDLAALTTLYGLETTSLVPERSVLVLDLDAGVLDAGVRRVLLGGVGVEEDDVLAQYLALVYSMRDVRPGRPVPLREGDIAVLASTLQRPAETVERDLHRLMADAAGTVAPRLRRLRGRVLIPAVGLVVAVTGAGMLLLVTDSAAAPSPDAVEAPSATSTEIGDAVVQERSEDGTPGPVVVRE